MSTSSLLHTHGEGSCMSTSSLLYTHGEGSCLSTSEPIFFKAALGYSLISLTFTLNLTMIQKLASATWCFY